MRPLAIVIVAIGLGTAFSLLQRGAVTLPFIAQVNECEGLPECGTQSTGPDSGNPTSVATCNAGDCPSDPDCTAFCREDNSCDQICYNTPERPRQTCTSNAECVPLNSEECPDYHCVIGEPLPGGIFTSWCEFGQCNEVPNEPPVVPSCADFCANFTCPIAGHICGEIKVTTSGFLRDAELQTLCGCYPATLSNEDSGRGNAGTQGGQTGGENGGTGEGGSSTPTSQSSSSTMIAYAPSSSTQTTTGGGTAGTTGGAIFSSSSYSLALTISIPSSSSAPQGTDDDGIAGNSRIALVASAPICGNGILEASEECDDSNRRDSDGCSSTCLLEIGICGDGKVQSLLGEQCEPSRHDSSLPYECRNCRFFSLTCGDGTVDVGEECDNGSDNSNQADASCRLSCSLARCGDGILDAVEDCDDGNAVTGDGCNQYCETERTQVGQYMQFPSTQGGFPQLPIGQPFPYQYPLAQLQPLIQSQGPAGETGPAAVIVIGGGAAAGWSWMRRKRK